LSSCFALLSSLLRSVSAALIRNVDSSAELLSGKDKDGFTQVLSRARVVASLISVADVQKLFRCSALFTVLYHAAVAAVQMRRRQCADANILSVYNAIHLFYRCRRQYCIKFPITRVITSCRTFKVT